MFRFNLLPKGFFDHLVADGKAKMAALAAYWRRLVMVCYGVLEHRAPLDPGWLKKSS